VIDSGSTDKTIGLVASFPNAEVHTRKFDTHAQQWNYGLSMCESEWILSLDADYILTDAFVEETKKNVQLAGISAFNARFEFLIFGKALTGNNTTPRPVLFRKKNCIYYDDGHTQRLKINGSEENYSAKILHDDRKPLSRWLRNQAAYSQKEADMLLQATSGLSFTSRLRKTKLLAPAFIFFYCLFIKGMILNGWRGWHYTLQRTIAEILVSMRLTEDKFKNDRK
jgi:glycosyltransferase involved in cell wall biosynthesis